MGLVVFTFGYETKKKWGLVFKQSCDVKVGQMCHFGGMVLSRKSKKCFYYWSVFFDNEGLCGSQWHIHCGHIYYATKFFTPFCYMIGKKNNKFICNCVNDN